MPPINVYTIILPSQDAQRRYAAHTSYGLLGQGSTPYEARRSAMSGVAAHLRAYARQSQPLPQPNEDLEALTEKYGALLTPTGKETREGKDGLPRLVFHFYRLV